MLDRPKREQAHVVTQAASVEHLERLARQAGLRAMPTSAASMNVHMTPCLDMSFDGIVFARATF